MHVGHVIKLFTSYSRESVSIIAYQYVIPYMLHTTMDGYLSVSFGLGFSCISILLINECKIAHLKLL
jgi:hypothetical protein